MKRSAMQDKVRTITVEWEDETVDVGIYPGRYTPTMLQGVAEKVAEAGNQNMDQQLSAVGEMVEPLLAWWDVLDDDGERLPTDRDTIATLSITFVQAVLVKAGESIRPPANGS